MTKVLINEYSHAPRDKNIEAGDEEKVKRGTVMFPIQYYLNNTVDPAYDLPVLWHDEFEIIHVISGEYHIFVADKDYKMVKDDICVIPGKVLHGDGTKKSAALYESVVFDLEMIRLRSYYPDEFINFIANGDNELTNIIPHTNTPLVTIASNMFEAFKVQPPGYELTVSGLLLQFFGEIKGQKLYVQKNNLSARNQRKSGQFEAVLNMIKKDYSQNLTLEDLADAAGLSPKYFCRLFREVTKRSPIEYLNWFRVNMACAALRDSDSKLADIAYDCGFKDFSYFIKTFKRYKGITPLKYRNFNRKD